MHQKKWLPDGGSNARIGVITPHLDPVPETEFQAMAPSGVSIHAARVPLGMIGTDGRIIPTIGPEAARAFSEPPAVDEAVSLLTPLEPGAIVYAFTSSSYILGSQKDALLKERLEERGDGIPVVIQTSALVSALHAVSAGSIALMHPPWFTTELDELGASYFANQGFEVLYHAPARLRREYGDALPEQIYDWARSNVPDDAEALVIGGGGFRAIGVIEALEAALDRPVLSANQASFWYACGFAGVTEKVPGYGRLFDVHPDPG